MRTCRVTAWARQRPDLWVGLGLAGVALALMAPYLFRPDLLPWPRSGLGTDFLSYRWSHVYHLRRSLREQGQIPLWRGAVLGGEPLIGNPAVMLFYPPQLLMALLPVPILVGFAWLTALHLWIAGMGAYMLLHRAMRLRRSAAWLGALAMLLSPRLSSNAVGDVGLDYAMCWVPLVLAWAKLALDRRRWPWAVAAGGGLACLFLLHVQFFFYTAWVIGLYLAYSSAIGMWPGRLAEGADRAEPGSRDPVGAAFLARGGLVALMAVVCSGLVAFELLPFVSYLPYLSRQTMSLAEANHYALPPVMLATAAMPSALKFPEWELYVGLLPLLLSPLALRHERRTETWFWLGLAVFALLFSLGARTSLFPFLYRWVPGFRWLRVPARMWYYASVAAVALTALAVDALLGRRALSRGEQRWLWIASWALVTSTVAGRWLTRRAGEADWLLGLAGVAGLALGLASVRLWARGRIGPRRLVAMLAGGLLLDLMPVDVAYMAPVPAEQMFRLPPIAAGTLVSPGLPCVEAPDSASCRVYSARGELLSHVVTWAGWEAIDGLNSFQFASYVDLVKEATGCGLPGFAASVPPCSSNEVSSTAYLQAIPDPTLLGLLNVRYVFTPLTLDDPRWILRGAEGASHLYENRAVLPRAFGVGWVEIVPGRGGAADAAVWQRLKQVDVSRVALVESDQGMSLLPGTSFHVPAEVVDRQPNRLRLRVEMPGEGMLVVSEVWVPGWKARDNGTAVPVLRVNGALRGVRLEPGAHEVELWFVPQALVWGAAISAATIVLVISALYCARTCRR